MPSVTLYRFDTKVVGGATVGQAKADVTDKIELDFVDPTSPPLIPDGRSYITEISERISTRHTDVANPESQATDAPDTGTAGLFIMITGIFDEKKGISKTRVRLLRWMLEHKTIRGIFPEGNIGIESEDMKELNVMPNKVQGLKLEGFNMSSPSTPRGQVTFEIRLRRAGNPQSFLTLLEGLES